MSRPRPRVITKAIFGAAVAAAGLSLLSGGPAPTRADIPYSQGFETTPYAYGWWFENGTPSSRSSITGVSSATYASGTYSIAQVASGNIGPWGDIGIPANGNYYAVTKNNPNANGPGLGAGGYSLFGTSTDSPSWVGAMDTYPGASFTQSVSVYVPATGSGAWAAGKGFEIDETANTAGTPLSPLWASESDFVFSVPSAGTVQVAASGGSVSTTLADITQNGWYTFMLAYSKEGNGTTDPASVAFGVYDSSGHQLGMTGGLLSAPSSDLGGTNYLWFTNWGSGLTSGNGLAFDNLATSDAAGSGLGTGSVPEPATLSLLALGGLGLLARRRRRKAAVT
jgi:hypothetical protein